MRRIAVSCLVLCFIAAAPAGKGGRLVFPGRDGKLQYTPDANGNRVPDFSNCGYMGGGVALPVAPVKATVTPQTRGGDDTDRIQRAIDQVSNMSADARGIRGAVLLRRGTYRVAGQLEIQTGGVVLRGEGDGENGTTLIAAGTRRRTLIDIEGAGGAKEEGARRAIIDEYVPVGSRTFTVENSAGFKAGDVILVTRVGNAAWIHEIAMDRIMGRPGNEKSTKQWQAFEMSFERTITAIQGNEVTIDAPIVCAIEQKWGGGAISKFTDPGRIQQVGVESLRSVSEYDKSKTEQHDGKPYASDEDHASYLVSFDDVKNAWARNLTTVHFSHGPSAVQRGAKWVTVQDCTSLEPVCVITGGRRYPYLINGQQNLVQRCKSDKARHAFALGSRVCGPNVFLDCVSTNDYATSEPHHRWSVGGLYDNVHAKIAFQDRQYMGSGHGWAGANYVAWNCEGTLVCQSPPTAQNWAIGFVGKKESGAFERPDGVWESLGRHVEPRSLYLKQLEDRMGSRSVQTLGKAK